LPRIDTQDATAWQRKRKLFGETDDRERDGLYNVALAVTGDATDKGSHKLTPILLRFLNLRPSVRNRLGQVFMTLLLPNGMKWDGCLQPFLWEVARHGPGKRGFRVRDALQLDAPRTPRVRLLALIWTHDSRGLPLYTRQWQTPALVGFCIWCHQKGFTFQGWGSTCYMGACRSLPANHRLRTLLARLFTSEPAPGVRRGARLPVRATVPAAKAPKPTTHRGTVRRMNQAEAAKRQGKDTRVGLYRIPRLLFHNARTFIFDTVIWICGMSCK
jgi:hypothetical protein